MVYNGAASIEKCMQSVFMQDYSNIEYLIIDGKSTDGTNAIIDKYKNKIDYHITEKDAGIYDAMNKGINAATGDFILFLNADDVYANSQVISRFANLAAQNKADIVLTGVKIFRNKKLFRVYKAAGFKKWMFLFGHQPPHPGVLCKATLLKQLNGFDTSFKIAGDFDLLLRLFDLPNCKAVFSKHFSVNMQHGGASSGGSAKTNLLNKEILKALKNNNKPSFPLLVWSKYIFKIWQLRL